VNAVRGAARWQVAVNALLGLVLLAAALCLPSASASLPTSSSSCHATWCADQSYVEHAAARSIAEQVHTLTAGRDCWTGNPKRWPRTVFVHDTGTTVVHEMTFKAAWIAGRAGRVAVDAKCA